MAVSNPCLHNIVQENGICVNCGQVVKPPKKYEDELAKHNLDLLHTPLIHSHNADGTCSYDYSDSDCAKIFVKPAKKSAKQPDKPNLSQAFRGNNPVLGV